MTTSRWQYKVIEIPFKLFGGKVTEHAQSELDKLGALGWELVSTAQSSATDVLRLFLKKAA